MKSINFLLLPSYFPSFLGKTMEGVTSFFNETVAAGDYQGRVKIKKNGLVV